MTRGPSTVTVVVDTPVASGRSFERGERALDRLGIDPDDRPGAGGAVGSE